MTYQGVESAEYVPPAQEILMYNTPQQIQVPNVEYPPGEIIPSYKNPIEEKRRPPEASPTIILGDEPVTCYCSTCKIPVRTRVEKHTSGLQFTLFFIFSMIFFIFAAIWLAFPCLKNTTHVCTRCKTFIGKKGEEVAIY